MECANCLSEKVIKYGFVRGKQRYLCYVCSYQFTNARRTIEDKGMALLLWELGFSRRIVGDIFGVDGVTIYRWGIELPKEIREDFYIPEQITFLESKREFFEEQTDMKKFNKIMKRLKRIDRAEEKEFRKQQKLFGKDW